MPVRERKQTVMKILEQLQGLDALKELFWTELNYERENQPLSMRGWPDSARSAMADDPILFASGGEDQAFHVVYCRLASAGLQRNLERPVVCQLIREHPYCLLVFSDTAQTTWHFLNIKYDEKAEKRRLFRRITVQADRGLRTAAERLQMIDLASMGKDLSGIPALEIQKRHDEAFNVESVTKAFYKELANWYFWALKHVRFPKDAPKEADGHDHIGVIRMITRLIFCWFVKEKDLIPEVLFDQRRLDELLDGFAPDKDDEKNSVFYKTILQNLFFATLNTEMDKRGWAKDEQNFMAHTLYRHRDLFRKPGEALALFKNIPFLNGGLFECLDRDLGENARPRYVRIDGFSRRSDSQPVVPDFLFFGPERDEDLSADYGDKKFRKVRVRGLIHTLQQYHFTIEENTPIEQEVALDPELSGKVFENLLAAYNPETGATARKQTGSFYTPREIVDYMVDEALIAFLKGSLTTEDAEEKLRRLMSWEENDHDFDALETESLITAIDGLKTLDPAVGSGAFPMGILHKLVFILGKLDPRNEQWEQRQIQRVRDAIAIAEKIQDAAIRERTVKELEQQITGIEEAFERNELDYGRKLYLIENCLYGVDIQTIAVQIAKMRFFISLIVDQRVYPDAANLGVRPLPNLETKFVAANTLIGIEKPRQTAFRNPDIDAKEAELRKVREKHFNARTPASKAKYRELDKKLRTEIAYLLKRDGWGDTTAKQLAAWDPYDQNTSASFFDPEWMFGIRNGFDLVIGNPPYGFRKIHGDSAKSYFKNHFASAHGSYEHYFFFYEASLRLLRQGGTLSFIAPVTWLTIPSAKSLRQFIMDGYAISEICWLSGAVFDGASVNTLVSIIQRNSPTITRVKIFDQLQEFPFSPADQKEIPQIQFIKSGYYISIFSHSNETAILEKIRSVAIPLSKVAIPCSGYNPYEVGAGIAPEGGLQTEQTVVAKPYHSSKKQGEQWKPEIVGRELNRYHVQITGERWVKYGSWLAAPRDPQNFKGKRILVQEITGGRERRIVAAFHDGELYHSRDVIPIKLTKQNPHHFYLLAVINSWLISWYHQKCSPKAQKGLFPKVLVSDLKDLPVCLVAESQQQPIIELVEKIIAAKATDPAADTSALEREIDRMVYALYGLTEEEIAIVEVASSAK